MGRDLEASLLACEGLAGVSLVPTAASKKMMLSQIASKQAENGERAGSPDVLRCSSQGHRKDSDKSRSRKDEDSLAEASHSKKTVKKVRSHLSVMYVICASFRSTTWSVTSVCTVVKSPTSVNGVIRLKEVKLPKDTAGQGQSQNSVKLQSWKKKGNLRAESQHLI
ncbi:zinc finger protein 740 isoform X7 [Myotis lucifugus]|uniref:zinc finger protein 740 isoform X7 n=1 Tax=Myotis lucifugus TaxID=59463 RepID=UPI000CCC30D0|nr:zinc finger protein 740 isoform X7 [Myotis lucifugus]